jgi:hypothetical protein
MKSKSACFALLLLAAGAPALAEIDQLQTLTQAEFRLLAEDLGSTLSYKPLQPTEAIGFPGFDIGVAVTGTKIKHQDLFVRATGDSDFPSTVVVPTVRVGIALPWDFDLNAMYSSVPKTGISLAGAALSWAAYNGSTWLPAFGVRASYTKMFGVDQLDFYSAGLDASISKGFGPFTPYLGAGKVWSESTPHSSTGLQRESLGQTKVFAGVALKITVVNLVVEVDRTGDANTCLTCVSCGDTCFRTCRDTCRTQCDQATCGTCAGQTTCGNATCDTCQTRCNQPTCGQATCQTCRTNCGTCETCQTQCGQRTCQTCRTDCGTCPSDTCQACTHVTCFRTCDACA